MNPTTARMVRVAHVATWTDRDGAHERAVNARLADLPGIALSVNHSVSISETSGTANMLFSTLIAYSDYQTPEERERAYAEGDE